MTTRAASHIGAPGAPPTTPAAPAAPPANSPAPAVPLTPDAIVALVKDTRRRIHDVMQIVAVLAAESSGTARRRAVMSSNRRLAVPKLSKLLRDDPTLSARYTADGIDGAMTAGQALEFLAGDFKAGVATVKAAAAAEYYDAWSGAYVVYKVAESDPNRSEEIAQTVTEVKALLAVGPRSKTAPTTIAKAQANATVVADRARRAQAKVDRQTRSAQRAAQAHADAHPDVTIIPATNPTPTTGNNNGK